ncbi:hypothetical protein SNE40_000506 [Patella caerulea]|uniref:Uncharacterized protein n=1 Tax=Patella caerulea TaxID=87958 RepID=A0AAN8QH16_PATCE
MVLCIVFMIFISFMYTGISDCQALTDNSISVMTDGDCLEAASHVTIPKHDCIEELGLDRYLSLEADRYDADHREPEGNRLVMDNGDCIFGDVVQIKQDCIEHLGEIRYQRRVQEQKEIDAAKKKRYNF